MGSGFWFEAGALVPSIGVGLLFWFVLKALLNADRREREALREAEQDLAEQTGNSTSEAPQHPEDTENSMSAPSADPISSDESPTAGSR